MTTKKKKKCKEKEISLLLGNKLTTYNMDDLFFGKSIWTGHLYKYVYRTNMVTTREFFRNIPFQI